jgi:hypothetical protein
MALYHRPRDHHDPTLLGGARYDGSALLPLILAAAIVVALITMFYPGSSSRVGDVNNTGPSVHTVMPSPSTSPMLPTPTPTTEPRPTRAPIR